MPRPLAIALLLTAGVCAAAFAVHRGTAPGSDVGPGAVAVENVPADWSYSIPEGTGALLDRGESVEILPARIEARVGQVIRIVNDDDRGYLLGPFYVGAHETLMQRFTSPGTFEGACAVHPSGNIVLEVSA